MNLSARPARPGLIALMIAACLVATPVAAETTAGTPEAGPRVAEGEATGAADLSLSRSLRDIEVTASPRGGDRIVLLLDGVPDFQVQEVEDPYRIVIDLDDTVSRLSTGVQTVNSDQVRRVRAGQFRVDPSPVARVVLDMNGHHDVLTRTEGRSVIIDVAAEPSATRTPEATIASNRIDTGSYETHEAAMPSGPAETAPAAPVAVTEPETTAEPVMPAPVEAHTTGTGMESMAAMEPPPAMEMENEAPAPATAGTAVPAETHRSSGARTANASPKSVSTTAPAAMAAAEETPMSYTASGAPIFEKKTIAGEQTRYTGKRISLNLVEADVKQIFRLFHEISGLNFVLDPSVSGRVTIVVDEVPWDQALDIILKNNGLDKVYEDNVIRIAPTSKLAQEAGARKALKEAKELEADPVTITRTLSYAKAQQIDNIIKTGVLLSSRGKSFYDERTNTIIITDVPTKIDPIDRLITSLDEKTPQVMIEARIVETNRSFSQDLGIQWGFSGERSEALGNPLDTQFPHNASVDWDLNLARNPGISQLGFSFGNISGSFQLDIALDALETEGKGRILSSPKIAAQNNESAEIEQGVRIPYFTTTATEISTEFVSASLKLKVTPQITAEGTISLDVEVNNDSPEFTTQSGDSPPGIRTQRAKTKVLVTDGGTTVIGGIFTINEGTAEVGVPFFRKIPFFKWLFNNRRVTSENRELLVFITPRILK